MISSFLKKISRNRQENLSCYGLSDTGLVRRHNEDSFCTLGNLRFFAVADGMGGHSAGEVASRLAIESLREFFSREKIKSIMGREQTIKESLLAAFAHANQTVIAKAAAEEHLRGMGCTMVACLVDNGLLHTCHVGDSRCYLLQNGQLQQITEDHTSMAYVSRTDAAGLTTQVLRPVVTRAIGFVHQGPEYHQHRLYPGDRILLCSDGLWNMVTMAGLTHILQNATTPREACTLMIEAANQKGGRDNITALAVFYGV